MPRSRFIGPVSSALTVLACAVLVVPTMADDHQAEPIDGYHETLKQHVDADGWVDYAALAEDRAALDAYVASLAAPDPRSNLSDNERLAHLINAYNAFTLQLILDNYRGGRLKSITDLHGGKPWGEAIWNLGGATVSLNHIEHEIIRKDFKEPRIHWALVCAAYSCPPLRNEAYRAETLKQQLAAQEDYVLDLNHPRYVRFEGGATHVTKIFEWYGDDFGDWQRYVRDRLNNRSSSLLPIKILDYDWRLNDVTNKPG